MERPLDDLLKHKKLKSTVQAMASDKSTWAIRKEKKKRGVKAGPPPFKREYGEPVKHPKVKDWDDEWLRKKYVEEEIGTPTLAAMTGRSIITIRKRLQQAGVKLRSFNQACASKNPCCNKEWLVFHYCDRKSYLEWAKNNNVEPDPKGGKRLPLRDCAKLAETSTYTIYNWLAKFKIPIRNMREASKKPQPKSITIKK